MILKNLDLIFLKPLDNVPFQVLNKVLDLPFLLLFQSCKASYPDLTLRGHPHHLNHHIRHPHESPYSPFLPACIDGGGGRGRTPAMDTCSCGHVEDTSSSHVSSSRDEDSPDTPLVSEDGRSSSSSSCHPEHPPPPPTHVRMDRESAV